MKTIQLKKVKTRLVISLFLAASMLIFITCKSTMNTEDPAVCMKYDKKSIPTLEVDFVNSIIKNYRNNQLKVINGTENNSDKKTFFSNSDANSIWFDLEKLKNYIYHIENQAQKNGKNSKELGIRFYYAAYPNKENWNQYKDLNDFNFKDIYENKHTLVLIPTINLKGKNTDFNPLDKNSYKEGLKFANNSNSQKFKIKSSNESFSTSNETNQEDTKIMSLNHGSLIPPPYPGQAGDLLGN
jgi:hypothetical protein